MSWDIRRVPIIGGAIRKLNRNWRIESRFGTLSGETPFAVLSGPTLSRPEDHASRRTDDKAWEYGSHGNDQLSSLGMRGWVMLRNESYLKSAALHQKANMTADIALKSRCFKSACVRIRPNTAASSSRSHPPTGYCRRVEVG